MFKERETGVIQNDHLNVPLGNANPKSPNLVKDYWQSVRDFIKSKLLQS